MDASSNGAVSDVAPWRLNLMRLLFLLIAVVMGSGVWSQLLFESMDGPVMRGVAKSMLAALALLSLLGVRYPLQMLPLMLFEIAWKTIWIALIAYPAWASNTLTADIESVFYDCVGIVVAYLIVPWGHVWQQYFKRPAEPWSKRDNVGRISPEAS